MKARNFLFDLDGTLTDPGEGITNSIKYALSKFGITPETREELYCMIGPPLLYSFEHYYGFDKEKSVLAMKYYREYFSERGIFENELYDGIPELLNDIKSRGGKIILATSKPDVYAIKILEHFGIYGCFDFVAGNTLEESRPDKPDVIRFALGSLSCDRSETVMVGDRCYDITGAFDCGITPVGVTYGYGDEDELHKAGCEKIAHSVSELRETLISLI